MPLVVRSFAATSCTTLVILDSGIVSDRTMRQATTNPTVRPKPLRSDSHALVCSAEVFRVSIASLFSFSCKSANSDIRWRNSVLSFLFKLHR